MSFKCPTCPRGDLHYHMPVPLPHSSITVGLVFEDESRPVADAVQLRAWSQEISLALADLEEALIRPTVSCQLVRERLLRLQMEIGVIAIREGDE